MMPSTIFLKAGMTPDPWQTEQLQTVTGNTLLLCSRQAGKSTCAAALALLQAILHPGSLVLLLSPTLRQSGELFRDKLLRLYRPIKDSFPATRLTALELELSNGSRIISLPENEESIRGFSSVNLLIIDEATRVDDAVYRAVRPMLAVSKGRILALSTPFGKRGWFFEAWEKGAPWRKVKITADQCPRITPEFLEQEKIELGSLWFEQEYFCQFVAIEGAEWPPDYFASPSLWFDDFPRDLLARAIACDPSKGKDAKTGDYAAFALIGIDQSGTLWVEGDLRRGISAEALAEIACEHQRTFVPDAFGVEAVQFQQLFAVIFGMVARRHNVLLPVQELLDTAPKPVRIRRLGPYLHQRKFRFRNTKGTQLLVQHLKEFPEGKHDDGCFVAGTLVETAHGPRPIEFVRPGELVLTRQGYRRVLLSGCTGIHSTITVEMEDGRTLTGTPLKRRTTSA